MSGTEERFRKRHGIGGSYKRSSARDLPTDEDLANAWMYIKSEFRFEDSVTGEMWAEGLAFGRDYSGHKIDFKYALEDIQGMRDQLPESAWRDIGARATYLAKDQYLSDWGVRGGKQQ